MKKLTLQFLSIALVIIGLSVVETSAQKRVNFDKDGKAKIKVTVKAKGKRKNEPYYFGKRLR